MPPIDKICRPAEIALVGCSSDKLSILGRPALRFIGELGLLVPECFITACIVTNIRTAMMSLAVKILLFRR